MKPVHVLIAAAVGAVIGAIASGLWWTARDRGINCLGGCSDKDLPAGDVTLLTGALSGTLVVVGVCLLSSLLWRRVHR